MKDNINLPKNSEQVCKDRAQHLINMFAMMDDEFLEELADSTGDESWREFSQLGPEARSKKFEDSAKTQS